MLKKRGQVESTIFIYILVLVIGVFIVIFGYKAVSGIGSKVDQAALVEFEGRLSADVESLTGDYGSVKIEKYRLPAGFDEICFVDLEEYDSLYPPEHPLMKNALESGAKKNVFLLGEPNFESFYIEGLQLYFFPFICTKTKGSKIELRMEGTMERTLIKTPASREDCQAMNDLGRCELLDFILGPGSKSECCKYNYCCG